MEVTSSFAEAYAAYWAPATGFARSLTRDHASAEDIVAAGLARVWRQWDSGRIDQPWAYVRRTIVNESITRARSAVREQAATKRTPPPRASSFEDAVVDHDLVVRLLAELPASQRRILELRFLEDLSERETALRLGISVGTVKSGTSRALSRLRAAHPVGVS